VAERSSRDRLIEAAIELFAANGFERTTVGEIEGAAGFTPRGGTMYKHFASKDELLRAAIDEHVRVTEGMRTVADLLPLGHVGAETTLWVRYLLAELSRHRALTTLIEKEGARYPIIAERFWQEIARPGYQLGADVLNQQLNKDQPGQWDHEALSVVLLGAVINYRRAQWTFGETPLEVSEERLQQVIRQFMEVLTASGRG
jgi:AcrR family transcriptional regulator